MSDEAVKKRLQRAIRAAIVSFPKDMGWEVERIYDPFFHLKVSFGEQKRWIRIVLDSISTSEKQKIKTLDKPGLKELWLRHKGEERFNRHIFKTLSRGNPPA